MSDMPLCLSRPTMTLAEIHWRSLYSPEQPRTVHGKRLGRPRGDVALLTVLSHHEWTQVPAVAERLGKTITATLQALQRARRRGLVQNKRGHGYRRTPGYRLVGLSS